ncbi:NUDIX domain-containing protein [Paenibacillus sp. TH7-28]
MSVVPEVPRLGVGAVILNERGEILLVHRNREPEKDTWSIPGGKVDPYETMESCVVREIKEEVDLDVEVKGLLCTAELIEPEKGNHWVSALYEVAVTGGEPRNMEEGGAIGEVRWFSLDRLPGNLARFTMPAIAQLQRRSEEG